MRLLLAILLCAPALAAALSDCPAVPSGFEDGFSIDIPASVVDGSLTTQAFFTTRASGSGRAAIVTSLNSVSSGTNPEYRVKLTDTAGADIDVCISSITTNASSELTMGFPLAVTAADGGRACLYIDTNASQSSSQSDCTTTGGFQDWDAFFLGGSLTDWSGNGHTLTTPDLVPATGTDGPIGHSSAITNSTNDAYYSISNTGDGVWEDVTFSIFFSGNAAVATDDTTGTQSLVWRNPAAAKITANLRWTGTSTGGTLETPRNGTAYASFGPIAATTDFSIICGRSSGVEYACWRAGVSGPVETVAWTDTSPASTTEPLMLIGNNGSGAGMDMEFHAMGYRSGTYTSTVEADLLFDLFQNHDTSWTVTALSTGSSTPSTLLPIWWYPVASAVAPVEWLAVAASTCVAGEVQFGDACVADPGAASGVPGVMDIQTGGLYQ